MAQINTKSAYKPQLPPVSGKFITVAFGLLVAVFSVLLFAIISTFFVGIGGKPWQSLSFALGFDFICYVLLSATVARVLLYLLNLVVLSKKLFDGFWESLED